MESIHNTRNIQKIILAILTAAPAIPPKPRIAAIKAITNNVIVQSNIKTPFFFIYVNHNPSDVYCELGGFLEGGRVIPYKEIGFTALKGTIHNA